MLYIDSKENNTFKKIKKYRTKKYRDKDRRFLAEGVKFLDFDTMPEYILLDENFSNDKSILEKIKRFDKTIVITLSEFLFLSLAHKKILRE